MKITTFAADVVVFLALVPGGVGGVAGGTSSGQSPLADAGLDQRASVGDTVELDATGSRDPEGSIAAYEWQIDTPGGATITPAEPTNPRTRFLVSESGRYEVTVTVTNDDGETASDTFYVDVDGRGEFDEPRQVSESDSADIVESASSTSGESYSPADMEPGGSGAAEANQCPSDQRNVQGFGCVPTGQDPYIVVSGPSTVGVGERARFSADVGGFVHQPSVSWVTGDTGSWAIVAFDEPGTYSLTAFASDGDSTVRDSATVQVIRNQPPTVDIRNPGDLEGGETVALSADASDPDGYIVSESWSAGPTVTVPENGSVTVAVTVYDNEEKTARDQIKLASDKVREEIIEEPKQVICSSIPGGVRFNCVLDSEVRKVSGEQIKEWKRSPEYEFDSVSGPVTDGDDEPIVQVPRDDMAGSGSVRYHSDKSMVHLNNGVINHKERATYHVKTETLEKYELNGGTVSADINNDGAINALDWDLRYRDGKDKQTYVDERQSLRENAEARREAEDGQGPTVSQESTSPNGAPSASSTSGIGGSSASSNNENHESSSNSRASSNSRYSSSSGNGLTASTSSSSGSSTISHHVSSSGGSDSSETIEDESENNSTNIGGGFLA